MTRPLLSEIAVSPQALSAMSAFHPHMVQEVSAAVAKDAIVVVGMAQNPVVKRARRNLDAAGLSYTYLEYGSYVSQWKQRLAVKLWSGWPTFPQVFVRGTLIGGNQELEGALLDGSLRQRLADK